MFLNSMLGLLSNFKDFLSSVGETSAYYGYAFDFIVIWGFISLPPLTKKKRMPLYPSTFPSIGRKDRTYTLR